jgi:uncharacterized membrane protein
MTSSEKSIRRIIVAGLLLAITILLVFTRIGMIPVPTPAGNATIAHIPAIIGGILEGPIIGLIVGLGFGLSSFMNASIPLFKDPLVAILPRAFIGLASAGVFHLLKKASKRTLTIMLGILFLLMLIFSREVFLYTRDAITSLLDVAEAQGLTWANIIPDIVGALAAILALALVILLYLWVRRENPRIVTLAIAATIGSLTNTVLVLSAAVWRGYIPPGAAWMIGLTHGIPEVIVSAIVVVAVVAALRQISRGRRGSNL